MSTSQKTQYIDTTQDSARTLFKKKEKKLFSPKQNTSK